MMNSGGQFRGLNSARQKAATFVTLFIEYPLAKNVSPSGAFV